MDVWRISNYMDLTGEGSSRVSGRWHTRSHPVVYTADSASAALLEILVHLKGRIEELSDFYMLLRIDIPDELFVETLTVRRYAWNEDPRLTQAIGTGWLQSGASAVARVPSVVTPHTWNYLLNPKHPVAGTIVITEVTKEAYDPRLFH